MSDPYHVDPPNPPADLLATRTFRMGIAGVLVFIAAIFIFVINQP